MLPYIEYNNFSINATITITFNSNIQSSQFRATSATLEDPESPPGEGMGIF